MMMPRLTVLLILLLAVAEPTPAEGPRAQSTLAEVLTCYDQALGGAAAFDDIDNLRIELDIAEPGFEVRGTYVASRDGRMRIDIYAGEQRVFAEGLDGAEAWQWTPDGGVTESNARGAAALRNGVEAPGRLWTLRQLRERGLQVERVDPAPQARDGERQLRLTRADGPVLDYFLDRQTCLPTREMSRRAFHPDVDPTEVLVETVFSEPFTVDGVLRFRRSEQRNLDNGEWLGTTAVRSVEHNVKLTDGFFSAR